MNLTKLKEAEYCVSGLKGFTLSEALSLWKTKFETVKHFQRDVINAHSGLKELGDFVAEVWETIKPVTVEAALSEKNTERRRVMFDCIGVANLFQKLQPEMLDRQVISKTRTRWDGNNKAYEHVFEDIYELYRIRDEKLFETGWSWRRPQAIYAVRCWCTTTQREFWIYVPEEAAMSGELTSANNRKPDAIQAIAWTIRIDITNPKRIFRQGDIIVVEESDNSQPVPSYHLKKEQYLELIFSET
ncbi:hypothetical protein ABIE26_003000 [Pedobacter africanus]|uniref:hypothetical protein n=1 Tax=Pedobacter africanus TaxID=151894 RepID=UPI00339A064F